MIKSTLLFFALFRLTCFVFAQGSSLPLSKPIVESPVFFNWPSIYELPAPAISNNGQYVFYAVRNIPAGRRSLIVQLIGGKDKFVLPYVKEAAFTIDSRF